jgi:regulation of enolase protein 1 (concanavalin A-like superfamily)
VAAVVAAPAPFPRATRQNGAWADGWDKPVGDGCFDRKGDELTITVPGKGLKGAEGRLLRDVDGDFAVQARVGGDFRLIGRKGFRVAGLIIEGGQGGSVEVNRNDWTVSLCISRQGNSTHVQSEVTDLDGPAYLRLERKGGRVWMACGRDGRTWSGVEPEDVMLPRKVKVGVVVKAQDEASFKTVFDNFKLTPLGRPAARPGDAGR